MADQIELTASFDVSSVIASLENLVNSFKAGGQQLTSALSQVNEESTALANSLLENLSTSAASAETRLDALTTTQRNLSTATTSLLEAEQAYAAASQNVAEAELLVSEAKAGNVTTSHELVTATKMLQESTIELDVASQNLGVALERNVAAEADLVAAREAAVGASQELQAAEAEIYTQANQIQQAKENEAIALQLSGEAAGVSATEYNELTEAQNRLATATQRLGVVENELREIEASRTASAGEFIAATQEKTAIEQELAEAEDALIAKTAEYQTELETQQAILQQANISWTEYLEAQQAVDTITQQLAASQALLGQSTAAVVGEVQALNAVTAETGNTLNAVSSILQANNVATQQTAAAINFLNNQNALLNASAAQVAQQINVLNTALARAGYQVQGTAGNLTLVRNAAQGAAQATNAAAGAVNNLGGAAGRANSNLTYLAGRLAAMELGMGNVGFAIGALARTSEGLGQILMAAFPIIAAVALFDVVSDLDTKFIKFQDSIRKTSLEFSKLSEESMKSADSIELQNLKLEDQIAKLEGRPEPNHLKEALLEAKDAADQLDTSLQNNIEHAIELIEKEGETLHAAGEFFLQGLATSGDLANKAFPGGPGGELRKSLIDASLALQDHKDATNAVADAKKRVNELTNSQTANTITLDQVEKKYNSTSGETKQAYYDLWVATINRNHALVDLKKAQEDVNNITSTKLGEIPKDSVIDYGQRKLILKEIASDINNVVRAEENEAQHESLLNRKAVEDKKTSYSAVSRAAEDAARKQLEINDLLASNEAARARNALNAEKAAAIQNGADRESLEVQMTERLTQIEDALITRKIEDQQKYLKAIEEAFTKEETLINQRKRGPAKTDALEDLSQRRTIVEQQVQATISKLEEDRTTKAIQLERTEAEAFVRETQVKLAATRNGSQQYIDILTRAIETVIQKYPDDLEAFRKLQEQKEAAVKKFNDEQRSINAIQQDIERSRAASALDIQRSSIETQYSLGLIGATQRIQQLRIVTQNEYAIELAAIEEKRDLYEKDTENWWREEQKRVALLERARQAETDLDSQEIEARLENWHKFEGEIITGFDRATSQMLYAQKSFGQGLAEAWNNMVVNFAVTIENMLLKWILNHTLMLAAERLFGVQRLILHQQEEAGKIASSAAGVGIRQELEALETQGCFGQTGARVAAHSGGEVAKTGATAAGVAAREGIEGGGTAVEISQTAARAAAHTSGEAAKTASTAAGESTRTGIISLHTVQHIALKTTELLHHIAVEIGKTIATATHSAGRFAIELAHYVKWAVMKVSEIAIHALVEAAKTAATAAGAAVREAVNIAAYLKDIAGYAAHAAAKIFADVITHVPFPVNLVLAPVAAAAVFTGVMAYKSLAGFATGGLIQGAGSGTSDSIPAMLSHGEFVINAATVSKLGIPFFNAINKGEAMPKFAEGGATVQKFSTGGSVEISSAPKFATGGMVEMSSAPRFATGGYVGQTTTQTFSSGGMVSVSKFSEGGSVIEKYAEGGYVSSVAKFSEGGAVEVSSTQKFSEGGAVVQKFAEG